MPRMPSRTWLVAPLLVAASACSLIDLDALQSGSGGAGATTSSTSTSSAASTSTVTSSTASAVASGSVSSSSGGCNDTFCADQTGLDGCADFDSPTYGLGAAWDAAIFLNGGTMGTVTTNADDATSCPTSAVVDIDATPNGRSWVQIARDVSMTGKHAATFAARILRSGPGGVPVDGAGLAEIAWDTGPSTYCQVYLQLYDAPSPMSSGSYFFLQHWDGAQTIQLTSDNLDLPAPTANVWAGVAIALDWTANTVTATVNGVSKSIPIPAPCNDVPTSVTGAWGVAYEDQSQTIRLDDLTSRAE